MKYYRENLYEKTIFYDGAIACLEKMAGLGWNVGIWTNKPEDLAEALNSVKPQNATTVRIQGLISSSLLSRDSVSLDSFLNASNQLGRYVEDSCGPGYPLLTTFTDLLSNQQAEDLEQSEIVINDFLDIWPKEETDDIDTK